MYAAPARRAIPCVRTAFFLSVGVTQGVTKSESLDHLFETEMSRRDLRHAI